GSFRYDQESGYYDLSWGSLAEFNTWRQEIEQADSVEIRLAKKEAKGVHYSWKCVYRCMRQGTGRIKPYEKKHPDQICKIDSKRTGCTCKVDLKAYPGTNILLGHYQKDHDHPINIQNLIYTQVSTVAKEKAREAL
ncbi:hypothetical protein EDB85DRAFT_1836550, partial [Lactarius pseudohatsudake]